MKATRARGSVQRVVLIMLAAFVVLVGMGWMGRGCSAVVGSVSRMMAIQSEVFEREPDARQPQSTLWSLNGQSLILVRYLPDPKIRGDALYSQMDRIGQAFVAKLDPAKDPRSVVVSAEAERAGGEARDHLFHAVYGSPLPPGLAEEAVKDED